MPKVLFLYSSPDDFVRLRLDKEHRALEGVLADLHVESSSIRQLHATTLADVLRVIQEEKFDVVHFSGHGSEDGIYLESDKGPGVLVSAELVVKVLTQSVHPIRAAVFMSCFSAEQGKSLLRIASHLVTVVGEADDAASICFSSAFYRNFFRTGSIESSFMAAVLALETSQFGALQPVLSRRGLVDGREIVQVFPMSGVDSLLVDITEAKTSIGELGIEYQEFLAILTRKIRIHRWIFVQPNDGLFLPIGPFFGQFSWSDGSDVIRCHRVVGIKEDVDEETATAWVSLVVSYNDRRSARYRAADGFPENRSQLAMACKQFSADFDHYFSDDQTAAVIRRVCPQEFKTCKAGLQTNLWMAQTKISEEDTKACIQYLETALSTLHDLVDAMASRILKAGPRSSR